MRNIASDSSRSGLQELMPETSTELVELTEAYRKVRAYKPKLISQRDRVIMVDAQVRAWFADRVRFESELATKLFARCPWYKRRFTPFDSTSLAWQATWHVTRSSWIAKVGAVQARLNKLIAFTNHLELQLPITEVDYKFLMKYRSAAVKAYDQADHLIAADYELDGTYLPKGHL